MPSQKYVIEDRGHETSCWVWTHTLYKNGYADDRRGRKEPHNRAHVEYYERAKGPVPEGLELDHLCRVRACVNPDHLEPVTHAENCRRGAKTKLNWDAVHAIRGSRELARDLAARYGVATDTIYKIRGGSRSWHA